MKMSAAKVVVSVVGLGVVGVLVWALVLEPRARRQVAQQAIAAWESDWAEVRRCIAGDRPLSQDPAENLALLQLTDFAARSRLERCRQLISGLRPPPGDDSGVPAIEDGWKQTADAVATLNASIADYAADQPSKPLAQLRADLVTKLAAVDARYAGLRQAAGLAPVAWPSGGAAPLPAAPAGEVLMVGGNQPLLPERSVVSGDTVAVFGRTGGGRYLVILQGPGQRRELPFNSEGLPQAVALAAPWAVNVRLDGAHGVLEAVALDSAGERDATRKPALIVKVPPPAPDLPADVTLLAAVGDGAARAVVYEVQKEEGGNVVFLARSKDGGATWSAPERLAEDATTSVGEDWARNRVDLVIESDAEGVHGAAWLPLDAVTLTGPLRPRPLDMLGDAMIRGTLSARTCPGKDVMWLSTMQVLVRLPLHGDGEARVLERPAANEEVTCQDALLVGKAFGVDDMTVVGCSKERCEIAGRMPWTRGGEVATVAGDQHGAAAVTLGDGFLLSWTRGENGVLTPHPRFKVPEGTSLGGVVEWNGVLQVVLVTAEQARLVALPE